MGTRILIPTDGTDKAADRIERAFKFAGEEDATVHALYIVDTRRYGEPALSSTEVLIECFEDEGREHLSSLVEAGHQQGISVEGHCRRGELPAEITNAAEELDVDLVIPSLVDVKPAQLSREGLDRQRIADARSTVTA